MGLPLNVNNPGTVVPHGFPTDSGFTHPGYGSASGVGVGVGIGVGSTIGSGVGVGIGTTVGVINTSSSGSSV